MSRKGPAIPGPGMAGGRLETRAWLGPNWCGTSKQRLEEIMKRTRKSEAAETKVRIPEGQCWEWGSSEERWRGKGI